MNHEMQQRFGVSEHLCAKAFSTEGAVAWALYLGHAAPRRFLKKDLALLERLMPLIGRGLTNVKESTRWANASGLGSELSEMVVLVRCQDKGRPAELLEATRPAAALLRVHVSPPSRNACFQELLALCRSAIGASAGSVAWQSADGREFRLYGLRAPAVGDDCLVVRLLPVDDAAKHEDDVALARRAGLTQREATVFSLVAAGKSNKEIAQELGISPHTIRTHVCSIIRRLGVSGRIEAINRVRELSSPAR